MDRCILCNAEDKTGLINHMCTACFDLSLDVGKTGTEIEKKQKRDRKALEKRRQENFYYETIR